MPQDNFTIHFGVLPENLDLVIPGVSGLLTICDDDSWHEWSEPFNNSYHRDQAKHVQIHTGNGLAMLPRVLSNYRALMVPSMNSTDHYQGQLLVAVTNRWEPSEQRHVGCLNLYAGQEPESEFIRSLNETQGESANYDEYDDYDNADNF